jgi:hypothetical protein
MVMSKASDILRELTTAKSKVESLEVEYRKHCECNDFLPGLSKATFDMRTYQKIYKTCNYHTVRMYHYA